MSATAMRTVILHPTKGFRGAPVGWRHRPHKIVSTSDYDARKDANRDIAAQHAKIAAEGLPLKYMHSHARSMHGLRLALGALTA